MSRSIFKLTVAHRCPEVFSNSLSHAGVQDYFQIDCLNISIHHRRSDEDEKDLTIKDKVFHMDGEFARLEEKL